MKGLRITGVCVWFFWFGLGLIFFFWIIDYTCGIKPAVTAFPNALLSTAMRVPGLHTTAWGQAPTGVSLIDTAVSGGNILPIRKELIMSNSEIRTSPHPRIHIRAASPSPCSPWATTLIPLSPWCLSRDREPFELGCSVYAPSDKQGSHTVCLKKKAKPLCVLEQWGGGGMFMPIPVRVMSQSAAGWLWPSGTSVNTEGEGSHLNRFSA